MKQVWILNHYAQDPDTGESTRHFSLAKYMLKHDWQSTIIAASVEHNTGRQLLNKGEKRRIVKTNGVQFVSLHTPSYRGNGFDRFFNVVTYSIRAVLPRFTRDLPRPDVIIGSSVHPFAAIAGAVLARRHNVPFVFEVRDLWPLTLIDSGRIKSKSIAARLLRFIERKLYNEAERIIVLLPKAEDYISPLGIEAKKIVWIPNGVDLTLYPSPTPPEPRSVFTLMYFGAHGRLNDLETLIEAMSIVQRRPSSKLIQLRLIGDGPTKPRLISKSKELELTNTFFEDSVRKEKIPALASEADAFVLMVNDFPKLYRYGISMNKLFDYMASARPTIIAVDAYNNPIQEAAAGITVPPGKPEILAQQIEILVNMQENERAAMGQRARNYIEKYHSYEMLAGHLAITLDEIT